MDSFDLLITNTTNAIIQGNTVGEGLEIIHDEKLKKMLFEHYNVRNEDDLMTSCENDWRFVIPSDIAQAGFLPRTPYVQMTNDPNWWKIEEIDEHLLKVVEAKRKNQTSSRRS